MELHKNCVQLISSEPQKYRFYVHGRLLHQQVRDKRRAEAQHRHRDVKHSYPEPRPLLAHGQRQPAVASGNQEHDNDQKLESYAEKYRL